MHLFFTGEKRVGKSTLLNATASYLSGKLGGFRTVRLNTYLPGQYTVHLFAINGSQEPSEENLLFLCGQRTQEVGKRFEHLGCQALAQSTDADYLIMDELGPHEVQAAAFQQAVWAALEGETSILGVLQEADGTFLEKIARHPKVTLVRVTKENRDSLAMHIPEFIQILMKR